MEGSRQTNATGIPLFITTWVLPAEAPPPWRGQKRRTGKSDTVVIEFREDIMISIDDALAEFKISLLAFVVCTTRPIPHIMRITTRREVKAWR